MLAFESYVRERETNIPPYQRIHKDTYSKYKLDYFVYLLISAYIEKLNNSLNEYDNFRSESESDYKIEYVVKEGNYYFYYKDTRIACFSYSNQEIIIRGLFHIDIIWSPLKEIQNVAPIF